MFTTLLELRQRSIHYLDGTAPAVYYIADASAGGVLVNAPAFDATLLEALRALAEPRYLFLPSRRGVRDLAAWRAAGLEVMAFEAEVAAVGRAEIDIVLDRKSKLTRTIDFLPMGGVTEGTCLMRLKNKPSTVFFGPALEPGADGWPTLVFHDDDHSYESRLFGALGLADLEFEHAFTDVFVPGQTRHGPAAGAEVRPRVSAVVEAD